MGASPAWHLPGAFLFDSFNYCCCLSTHRHLVMKHRPIVLANVPFSAEPRKPSCSERVCYQEYLWPNSGAYPRQHHGGQAGKLWHLFCKKVAAEPLGSTQPPHISPRADCRARHGLGVSKRNCHLAVSLNLLWPVPGLIPEEQSPTCESIRILKQWGRGRSSRSSKMEICRHTLGSVISTSRSCT